MTDQQFQQYYPGWGRTEAEADWNAVGKYKYGGTSSGNYSNSLLSQMGGSVDKYVQDLLDFAKDDYDFAAKWIEQQYTQAMGTNDQSRKDFLKEVANDLESKVGTVAFDYQTNKYRLQEDTTKALDRLNQDEQVVKQNLDTTTVQEKAQQNSALNQRGLIAGTRENATGLAGKNISDLNTNIQGRYDALARSVKNQTQDINQNQTRGLADLTTTARRTGENAVNQNEYSVANAQRTLAQKQLEAEQARKQQKDYLAALEGAIV